MRKREPDRLTKGWARWSVSREPAGGCAAFGQLVGVLLAAETIWRSAQRLRQPSLHRLGVIWPNQRHRAAAVRRARQQAAPEDLGRRVVREHAAVRGGANRVGARTERLVATDEADALDGAGRREQHQELCRPARLALPLGGVQPDV